jgi:hypothetical protein
MLLEASDLNKIEVSGKIKSCERKESQNERKTVFYEAVLISHYENPRTKPKDFEFTIVAYGDAGKKLGTMQIGSRIVVNGRLENYTGTTQDGRRYTGYYKIIATEIHCVEQIEKDLERSKIDPPAKTITIDDIPF